MGKVFLRDKSIMEQVNSIKYKFPDFKIVHDPSHLKITANIRPTSRSVEYKVEIRYKLKQYPKIWVLNPVLKKNASDEDIPHMYEQERLCLFQPKYGEFRFGDYISDTIVPWVSLWLFHYENWHMTGKWEGGGEHPTANI
jgi:hypothetical protein